ncbi:MAG: hypothetical protein H6607_09930 [Flavobacteriales bacterium]|nr:hypothetical protein [Flavobacteriales bacterium]
MVKSFQKEFVNQKPIVLIEILPVYEAGNTFRLDRQNEIVRIFKECDYSIFKVSKPQNILVDVVEIDDIGIHGDITACDYIMVPNSKKAALTNAIESKFSKK